MKKNIATLLRRMAQWLDPQDPEITGYARKVVDFIPYNGIDTYRQLVLAGEEYRAREVKSRMRTIAEISAIANLGGELNEKGVVRLEHNFGTTERVINGIKCQPNGVTVVVELRGTWS